MSMPICTGRWGCGAFKGDNYLKFMVQWIACAIANRKMVYKAQDDSEEKELKTMYKFMAKYEVA
jgi:poly(ADP-ribose) glycohydrolase